MTRGRVVDGDFQDGGRQPFFFQGKHFEVWFQAPMGWFFAIESGPPSAPFASREDAVAIAQGTIAGHTRPAGRGGPPPPMGSPMAGPPYPPDSCEVCGMPYPPAPPEPMNPKWGAVIGAAVGAYFGHLILDDPGFVSTFAETMVKGMPEVVKMAQAGYDIGIKGPPKKKAPKKKAPKKKASKNSTKEGPLQ